MTRALALVVRAVATCCLPHDHTAKQHPRVRHAYRPGRLVSAFVALGRVGVVAAEGIGACT